MTKLEAIKAQGNVFSTEHYMAVGGHFHAPAASSPREGLHGAYWIGSC
jgi:hypothetical protein